jgi:hypothetical protein
MREGKCCLSFVCASLMSLETLHLYKCVQCSSFMSTTSPNLSNASFIVRSRISGGSVAKRISHVPKPAISSVTVDCSPVSCLYGNVPLVSCMIRVIRWLLTKLIYTSRLGPWIWIILTSSSRRPLVSYIHTWIWYAEILGLLGSKIQTRVFWRLAIDSQINGVDLGGRRIIKEKKRTHTTVYISKQLLCQSYTLSTHYTSAHLNR